jgi:hypothetical protein
MQPRTATVNSSSICALLLILQHVIDILANGTNEASKLFVLLATSALADLKGVAQMATFRRSGNVLHGLIKPRPLRNSDLSKEGREPYLRNFCWMRMQTIIKHLSFPNVRD